MSKQRLRLNIVVMKLLGVDVTDNKSLYYGLMEVRGIGPYVVQNLIKDLNLGEVLKVRDLTTEQQAAI